MVWIPQVPARMQHTQKGVRREIRVIRGQDSFQTNQEPARMGLCSVAK